jgi:formate hydrogenlyase transcriptional activator
MEALKTYDWLGNIRELENLIHLAMIVSPVPDLMVKLSERAAEFDRESSTLQDVERNHILRLLKESAWKIEGRNGAADRLGLNPGTLRSRIKKLGIQRPQ